MTDAATANRRAREAAARDMAERRARLTGKTPTAASIQGVTQVPATPRNALYVDPGASRTPVDDPDSAEGVLADAHAAGLPGLKRRGEEPAAKSAPTADPDSDEAVLDLARAAGLPGLRKR